MQNQGNLQQKAKTFGAEWLVVHKAVENYDFVCKARVPLSQGGLYELLCFYAQQAAEQSVKAVFFHYGMGLLAPTILSA